MNTKELEKPKRDKTCRAARSRNSDEGGQGLQSGRIGCAGSIIAFLFSGMEGAMSVEAQGNDSTGLLRSVWYQSISNKRQDSIYSIHLIDSICQKIGLARPKIGSELWEVIHQVASHALATHMVT